VKPAAAVATHRRRRRRVLIAALRGARCTRRNGCLGGVNGGVAASGSGMWRRHVRERRLSRSYTAISNVVGMRRRKEAKRHEAEAAGGNAAAIELGGKRTSASSSK